jgi:hypothetical protein
LEYQVFVQNCVQCGNAVLQQAAAQPAAWQDMMALPQQHRPPQDQALCIQGPGTSTSMQTSMQRLPAANMLDTIAIRFTTSIPFGLDAVLTARHV